ncbi:MAG: phytanoyl-CoA dioxygenase family protein [Myxococcota bacterium]
MNKRFSLDNVEGWTAFLHEHGYAVVADVLTKEQVSEAVTAMWGIMEALGNVRRDDPRTWVASKMWPPMLHGGMIQYLGHTPVQWALREQCATVFSKYYDVPVDQLATSFDGLCFMSGRRRYQRRGDLISFLHTDQSPLRRGEWSIQGVVNLGDAGPDDGGLVVVPGTHREHEAFFTGHPRSDQKSDWYKLSDAEKAPYQDRALKVCAEPGDVLLWDSRTLHCNTVPTRPDAARICAYVCQLPQHRVPPHIRQKRQDAYDQRRTSSHHPGDGFRMFPKMPRFVTDRDRFLAKTLTLQNPSLNATQRALRFGVD